MLRSARIALRPLSSLAQFSRFPCHHSGIATVQQPPFAQFKHSALPGRQQQQCFASSFSSAAVRDHQPNHHQLEQPIENQPGNVNAEYREQLLKLLQHTCVRPVRLGLHNTHELQQAALRWGTQQLPVNTASGVSPGDFTDMHFVTVHVSGSNGKGSVSAKIAAGLQAQGLRVGLLTSPHLSSVRERIRINGAAIPENTMSQLLGQLFEISEAAGIEASFFELTTLLAYGWFARAEADVAVIEGDLAHIAREKAGIIKPGVPVVLGPSMAAHPDVLAAAAERQSPVVALPASFQTRHFDEENNALALLALETLAASGKMRDLAARERLEPLHPEWTCMANRLSGFDRQLHLARERSFLDRLRPLAPAEEQVVRDTVPDCRFQQFPGLRMPLPPQDLQMHQTASASTAGPVWVVLDVAHNPDAMQKLAQRLELLKADNPGKVPRHWTAIVGMCSDKDVVGSLALLSRVVDRIVFVTARGSLRPLPALEALQRIQKEQERLVQLEGTEEAEQRRLHCPVDMICEDGDIATSIRRAVQDLNQSEAGQGGLLVCGSFYLMPETRATLGIPQEMDPVKLGEQYTMKLGSPTPSAASKP